MVGTIKNIATNAIRIFNKTNDRYLVFVLWCLIVVIMAVVSYGAIVHNQSIIIQAGLLIPIGSFALFGAKVVDTKQSSVVEFIHGLIPCALWAVSISVILMIVPWVGYEVENRLLEDNTISADDIIDIYPFFGIFYSVFVVYLPSLYIIRFIGVQLKDYGAGSAD